MSILATDDRPVRAARTVDAAASWRAELRGAVRSGRELCRRLGLPEELAAPNAEADFPVLVPPAYLTRIRPGDPDDPLLRQVLPIGAETEDAAGFSVDPVGDGPATVAAGVLHKYHGRALLIAAGACAVHCRYCFRRHFPYDEAPAGAGAWDEPLGAIADDPSIREVILSGGDPLMLVDERLAELVARLEAIDHVRRLRIHTRLPIVVPSRVTDALCRLLRRTPLTSVVVLHANHARELDAAVGGAVATLRSTGATLLNQAVLLRGVNDTVEAQAELSERLAEVGVVPYYLHQLDRVAGAAHFEVPEAEGLRLMEALRARLPGYLVPRYVRETAGELSKTVLA